MLAIDAVCMGLLAAAAIKWEGTNTADDLFTVVVVLQLFTLCGEAKLSMSDQVRASLQRGPRCIFLDCSS